MTASVLDTSTAQTLSGALGAHAMTAVSTDAANAIGSTVGSVLVAEGSRAGRSLPEAIVAIVDRPETTGNASADDVLAVVIASLGETVDGLTFGSATPMADIGDAIAAYPSISEALTLLEGSDTVGAVLWVADRRNDAGPAAAGSGADAAPHQAGGNTLHGSSRTNGLAMLRDVELDVSVELGRTDMTLAEVMALHIGSIVELDRPAGSPVDVRVNGTLLARGEVVVIDGEYAVRISEVVEPESGHSS